MNKAMMMRFLLVFSGIAILICGSTFLVFKRRLKLLKTESRFVGLGFFIIAVLMVVGPMIYRASSPSSLGLGQTTLQYAQYFLMGWVATNFLFFLVVEILQAIAKPFDQQKRLFLTEGVTKTLIAGTTLATVGGLIEAGSSPAVKDVEIKLKTLPKSFDGMSIVQISDVHIGPLLHDHFLEGVVEQVLSKDPDMIFITGDLVDGTVEQLSQFMESLKKLKAKDGVYFCTGNHEFYSGVEEWIRFLRGIGIHVFENSNVVLNRKGANGVDEKLLVAGVHDWQSGQHSPEYASDCFKAAQTKEPVNCKILLAHNPFSIDPAAEAGFDFQASGHTHAGQFYPFAFIVKLKLKHSEGLYRINDKTQLYVNRGTGYWGPPNRLGKRSEITHYTLRSEV